MLKNIIPTQMTKQELRSETLKRLSSLSLERRTEANIEACHFLMEKLIPSPKTMVLSFASKPFEISLWAFNKWLADSGRLLLPRVESDSLQIYHVTSWKQLYISSLNIQEPNPFQCEKVINLAEIPYALVPAVCFDGNKHRLGHGKGLYDKLLPLLSSAQKWGVGFKEQLTSALPVEPHDISLDEVFLF